MSKMSNLILDIEDLLNQGKSPMEVSCELEISVHWVYEAQEMLEDSEKDLSPFVTINS